MMQGGMGRMYNDLGGYHSAAWGSTAVGNPGLQQLFPRLVCAPRLRRRRETKTAAKRHYGTLGQTNVRILGRADFTFLVQPEPETTAGFGSAVAFVCTLPMTHATAE
ncbi:predicted protein [Chaetomium globosum CBS 148.51]|uniref:Uncharacterized protein n=1 Tax=Chaetomium globosum (strain ATCC 6205 / CBS 148.51 / DSM 1962 / NBRC 6347 / NRRL 1970) TaxID=306901 RepID=Q2HBV3_CHAGB|nr:uncharacterized protein CHGG_02301 [Chaetomium globosum CBS 148.51]EAQ90366.1 predicted protein [Chaetomium globosum CBS 148.51]